MLNRIRRLLVKEFLQMLRDPRMRAVVFVMPVVQMVVVAFALTTDVVDIRTAVVDLDGTPASRELVEDFIAGGYFKLVEYVRTDRELERWLDAGHVRAILHIPMDFEANLRAGRTARAQLLVDGSDSNNAAIIFGYAGAIAESFSRRKQEERLAAAGGARSSAAGSAAAGANGGTTVRTAVETAAGPTAGTTFGTTVAGALGVAGGSAPIELQTRSWFNPNLESKYYNVPGLVAVMLMVVSLLLTSIAIVREKEIGTIEQVLVTPITRMEFILGKTIPFLITGYITMSLMLLAVYVVFGIPVQGSLSLLCFAAGIYIVGNLGIALVISGSASTQQQALLTAFLVLMPGVLLSGFLFPIRNMPDPVQYATYLNPMRWFLEILRGIVVKGIGLDVLWPEMFAQTALACAFLIWAAFSFRKTAA